MSVKKKGQSWKELNVWTCISVSIPEQFVQQVTELPADHRVAGEWQVEGVGPKGGSSTLFMTPHNNIFTAVRETWTTLNIPMQKLKEEAEVICC